MNAHEDGRIARGARHREALVDAANALIHERSSATMTADEIASRAGVSRRTVFNHFGSVDEIVTAACTRELAAAVDAMQEASAQGARHGASSSPAFDALAHIFTTLDLTPTVSYLAVVLEPHGVRSTARHRFDEIFWEAGDLLASLATPRETSTSARRWPRPSRFTSPWSSVSRC